MVSLQDDLSCVQSGHAALVGALRREEAAARCVARLTRELEAVREVIKQREMDAQRTKMIIRLKEDKIARLQVELHSPLTRPPLCFIVLEGNSGMKRISIWCSEFAAYLLCLVQVELSLHIAIQANLIVYLGGSMGRPGWQTDWRCDGCCGCWRSRLRRGQV